MEIALLLAVGYVLRLLVPPIFLGMKPDVLLGMLFIIILLKKDFRLRMQAGMLAGIITAMTTAFPGGQIPNLIDKMLTTLFVLGLVRLLSPRLNERVVLGIVGALGTLFSGTAFLVSAALLVGLPGSFAALFITVVLPATVVNTVAVVVLYPVVAFSRRTVRRTVNGKVPQAS